MRGIPSNPVTCRRCDRKLGAPKDQLCHACRITSRLNPNKKFFWNTELDARLRSVYVNARNREELTTNLNYLQKLSGFTRVSILSRAAELGLSAPRRRWKAEEIDLLQEELGKQSKSAIARKIGRSYWAVKAQVSKLQLSARLTEGYSEQDLIKVLGVGRKTIQQWIARGWLLPRNGRVPERTIARFLRAHPEQYNLRRVDEAWFKGLLFPVFGREFGRRMDL